MDVDMEFAPAVRSPQLKGKGVRRGWGTLPPDVLMIVFSHLVRDYNAQPTLPGLGGSMLWANRLVFSAVRSAYSIEPVLAVCRHWRAVLSNHDYYEHVCATLDPARHVLALRNQQAENSMVLLGSSTPAPVFRCDHAHYHWIRATTCIPCRMQNPHDNAAPRNVRRLGVTMYTGRLGLCREHKLDAFCGVCLRSDEAGDNYFELMISKNEDDESFPAMEATCFRCRQDALYLRGESDDCLREALKGIDEDRSTVDWEVRQAVTQFLDYGEGSVARTVRISWEKRWLRTYTKLVEYLDQAVASVRYQNREEGYESEDEISDDEDVLCYQEEAGVRDIALSEYCRARIMDGHWILPYDLYLGLTGRQELKHIPAHHPIPYMLSEDVDEQRSPHPTSRTVEAMAPPTPELAQQLSYIFQKELREVLVPAFRNLALKVVFECEQIGTDPTIKVGRMSLEDVVIGLRSEGVWWEDFDWAPQWAEKNKVEELTVRRRANGMDEDNRSTSSTASSESSVNSHGTSPVLSTSTLQTTPSPPPNETRSFEKDAPRQRPSNLPPATLLRAIPFIPETSTLMPHHTKDLIRVLWRDATAPLYSCQCTICMRALKKQISIAMQSVREIDLDHSFGDDDSEYLDDSMDEDPDVQEAIEFERIINSHVVPSQNEGTTPVTKTSAPRKRSSEELYQDDAQERDDDVRSQYAEQQERGSPPNGKRAKISDAPTPIIQISIPPARKRGSEEMDSEESTPSTWAELAQKRVRSSESQSTPRALSRQNSSIDPEIEMESDGSFIEPMAS